MTSKRYFNGRWKKYYEVCTHIKCYKVRNLSKWFKFDLI